MPEIEDQYCIVVKRFGALGIEEREGRLHVHMAAKDDVAQWLTTTLDTLGPGDRAEIMLTRGQQRTIG
jgi:hypothetical protein